MQYSQSDHQYMAQAITLAKKGQYTTTPNPNVGCVIVKNGQIIGQGWHKKAGTGHAEVNALANLSKSESEHSTAYVTLEPCSHFGRTPPCAIRLIDAGVKTVYIAMLDTNPQVSGNGVKLLEEAGINVYVGLLEQDARAINAGFFTRMEQQRPYVQIKMASSMDGKIALSNGESKWITGAEARADVQTYRAKASAILSTANTVLADDAKLNVRCESFNFHYPIDDVNTQVRQPIRIILDSKNELSLDKLETLALFAESSSIYLIRKQTKSEFNHVDWVHEIKINYDDGFNLNELLSWCSEIETNTLWVEAGSKLAASFVEASLFDELIVYMAPKIMGAQGKELIPVGPFTEMNQTIDLSLSDVTKVGSDVRFTYQPIKTSEKQ